MASSFRQSGSLLKRIPFIDEEEEELPAKRVSVDSKALEAALAEEGQRLLTLNEAALSDFYLLTNRDWIHKHWHTALANADVAVKYSLKSSDRAHRLSMALERAVVIECLAINKEIARLVESKPVEKRAFVVEPTIVLLRNFIFRTQQRIQAVPVLDLLYFRVLHKHSMLEHVLSIFSQTVLTHEWCYTLATLLLELCHLDFAEGCVWTLAFLNIYNEPGMGHPRATPWQTILDELWEKEIEANTAIVAAATSPDADQRIYTDPAYLVSNINGWILNILHSASFCLKYTNGIRTQGKRLSLDLQDKAWLDRLAQSVSEPYEIWAAYAVIAANDPILTSHTTGMLQEFFSDGRHSIWSERQWPDLFSAVNDHLAKLHPNAVSRLDMAWRVLQRLKSGIASTQQEAFKEAYFKEIYDQIGYKFCADLYELLLKHNVGASMGSFGDLFNDVTKMSLESLEQSYFDEAVLGSQSRIVRAFEERLKPLSPELARSVLSAVLFAHSLDSLDTGRLENELYITIARLHLPQPIGQGFKSSNTVMEIFNDVTKDQYHHAMAMIAEIENARAQSSNVLVLNSGNWMSSADPFLSKSIEPEILRHKVHVSPDELRQTSNESEKIYRWHRNWSAVLCELNNHTFSCSWLQLDILQTLLSSGKPLSDCELLNDQMPEEFAVRCLEDMVRNSGGFIKQTQVDGAKYYAVDSSIAPSGNWMRLEFADEW